MEFTPFPKIARLSRDVVITEKLDGTNAQVNIVRYEELLQAADLGATQFIVKNVGPYAVFAGSRSRWITPNNGVKGMAGATDNFGFAAWVRDNAAELVEALGEGTHFGEWWGQGIQRGYGLNERRFSLFNTKRWGVVAGDEGPTVGPCHVVPTLYTGPFDTDWINSSIDALNRYGSYAARGFMKPEGIVIYHTASNQLFKKTIEKDDEPKGKSNV